MGESFRRRADALVPAPAARAWRSISGREGSQGWLRAPFVALRGGRLTSAGRRRAGGLIGARTAEGKHKY